MIRLFIAAPVPESIKGSVGKILKDIRPIFKCVEDIRFVSEENWHFTVTFLGYQEETKIPIIEKSLREAVSVFRKETENKKGLYIIFHALTYGPVGKTPRMIWLTTTKKTSEELGMFKGILEDTFEKNGIRWRRESRPLRAHLTLARFSPVAKKKLPTIDRDISFEYRVQGFDFIQSTLRPGGAVYKTLSSVDMRSR